MRHSMIFFLILTLFSFNAYAHGKEEHKKDKKEQTASDSLDHHQATTADLGQNPMSENHQSGTVFPGSQLVHPKISDFPSLHPLIVHFPIVLLILAFLLQVAALFWWKKELSLISGILLLLGFITAYLASGSLHPHTEGLNDTASSILSLHDQYAEYTLWLSGIALLLKILSHFLLQQKIWMEVLVAALLAATAYSVSQAGHYGAALVHLQGVGPQGKQLELGAHEHE